MNLSDYFNCKLCNHAFTRKTAKDIRMRDDKKIEYLSSLGYKVLVIWESDWKCNKEQEKMRIKDAFHQI